jgi:Fic family protein
MPEVTAGPTQQQDNLFVPAALGSSVDVHVSYDLLTGLSKANRSVGHLDGLSVYLDNPESFTRLFELKDTLSARRLQGNTVSALDYFEAILSGGKGKSADAISHLRKEIKELHTYYKSRREVTLNSISELYQSIYDPWIESDFGLLRSSEQPEDYNTLTAKFTRKYNQPTGIELQERSENLLGFLQEDTGHPLLMKAAMAYAQWNFLQPFENNNASFGSILAMKWLIENGMLKYPLFAMNPYFEGHKVEFQFRFLDLVQTGDWGEWLTYFILGVNEAATEAINSIRQAIELQRVLPKSFKTISGHVEYAEELFGLLFNQPLVHIQYVAKKLDVAFGTANSLVQQFEDMDIVTEITGQSRNKRYLFSDYFYLFFEKDQ